MIYSYKKLLQSIFQFDHRSSIKLGLNNILALSQAFGFPEKKYPTIHVAGTNGKGSVSTKIATALQASGLNVGLYTSPHLFSFRERIVVKGEYISQEEVLESMHLILEKQKELGLKATFFELTTMLAFYFFHIKKVEIAVIETGLGGRLDATNIIIPLLSIITSIGYDHEEFLGSDLESIALEKAGIIKPHVPVVIGPYADFQSIHEQAKSLSSPLIKVAKVRGFYDKENSEIANAALELLKEKIPLSARAIETGLSSRPLCRFEECDGVIFDVAHNLQGIQRLLEAIDEHYPKHALHFVIGMSHDKDTQGCLKLLASQAQHIYLVEAPCARAAKAERLARELRELHFEAFSIEKHVKVAVQRAKAEAKRSNALLVICGSFYIMPEAKIALNESVVLD